MPFTVQAVNKRQAYFNNLPQWNNTNAKVKCMTQRLSKSGGFRWTKGKDRKAS